MPLFFAYDKDTDLLLVRFAGNLEAEEIADTYYALADKLDRGNLAKQITHFAPGVDLSHLTYDRLSQLRTQIATQDAARGVTKRINAFLMENAQGAKVLLPLWRALWELGDDHMVEFETFQTVEDACAWLEVDADVGRALMANPKPADQF